MEANVDYRERICPQPTFFQHKITSEMRFFSTPHRRAATAMWPLTIIYGVLLLFFPLLRQQIAVLLHKQYGDPPGDVVERVRLAACCRFGGRMGWLF